jgi:hypothetical protein
MKNVSGQESVREPQRFALNKKELTKKADLPIIEKETIKYKCDEAYDA